MAKISKDGLDLIKEFESFVGYVYDDLVPPIRGKYPEWTGQKPKGTLTIGYGHTNAAKDSLKCTLGTKVTMAQALTILSVDLGPCEDTVNKLVKCQSLNISLMRWCLSISTPGSSRTRDC